MSENKNILKFEVSTKNLKVKNLISQDFLEIELDMISNIYPNRNRSTFLREAMINAVDTVYNKPVLASFDSKSFEFGGHDDNNVHYDSELDEYYYDYNAPGCEHPIGVIRSTDKVEVVDNPVDGLAHMKATAVIWTAYSYAQCKKLLKNKRTKVSVEVEVTDYEFDKDGIEIIKAFKFLGVTLLSNGLTEAINNSNATIPELEKTSVFQAQRKKLSFALQQLEEQQKHSNDTKIEKPDNSDPIESENQPRVSMEEPNKADTPEDRTSRYSGISVADLTYEQKKSLIAQEFMRLEDDADFWIEDISDTYVIIYYHSDDEHCNYKVGYIIDDDPNHTVHLDWDNKEKVIQTWKTFEKDNDSTNTNKIFDSKEDTPEMREVFKRDCEQSDIKADESPMDNNTPDSKAKFESKDIVENPGPEMGIVMAADEKECNSSDPEKDKECNSSEEKECNSSDGCEKECNASDDSKEECAEDKCPDCGKPMSECNCKDTNACEEPEKNCNSEEGCKESEACDNKEVEGCENKETEGCKDSEACKDTEGCKETEGCEDKEEEACGDKDSECGDKMCNSDETTSETFSDEVTSETFEKFTVNVHGEDLNINQLLEKFTALEDSYNNLKEKYSAFEMKEFKAFALDTINKESRLLDETKTNVRDEVMNAIDCGKFSTKDEVEKFTVQSMAMALFNQKEVESTDNTEKESEGTKSDFEATIVKNPVGADENKVKKAKTGIDSLLEANNALKFV